VADIIIPDVPDHIIAAIDVKPSGWVCHETATSAECWLANATSSRAKRQLATRWVGKFLQWWPSAESNR
jgi:hypothetical protein